MKRFLSLFLALIVAVGVCLSVPMTIEAEAFSVRTTKPTTDNAYYYSNNPFYKSGYGMPNCTCYAFGRAYEVTGTYPKLSTGNANTFWTTNLSNRAYAYGQTPKAGSIACWNNGTAGHVAFVESVNSNGTFNISESNWSGRTDASKAFRYLTNKTTSYCSNFQGFIYIVDGTTQDSTPSVSAATITEDLYYLKNKSTGDYLSVSNSEDRNEADVSHYAKDSHWQVKIKKNSNGYEMWFPNISSTRVVNQWGSAPAAGAKITLYTHSGNKTQSWIFQSYSGGYLIRSAYNTNLFMTINSYGQVILDNFTGGSGQIWYLEKTVVKPSWAKLTASATDIPIGGSITFNASSDTGEKYCIAIFENGERIKTTEFSSAVTFTFNAPGKYSAYVTASNTAGWVDSSYIDWTVHDNYTVSYNANGGTGAPASQTKVYGTNLTLSTTKPTRTGYTFKGWGTSTGDTSVNYNPGDTYKSNSSITLYAIWSRNSYNVYYNANGGRGEPASQTKYHDEDLTLSSVVPTRSGYTFLGWGTSAGDTSVNYAPGGTYTKNEEDVLYAIWECNHTTTTVVNAKDPTTTEEGYTGDKKCDTCGKIIATGSAIEKLFEAPASVKTSLASNGINVTWSAVSGAEKYEVYRGTVIRLTQGSLGIFGGSTSGNDGETIEMRTNAVKIATVSNVTSFLDTSVEAGKYYYYGIKAIKGDSSSELTESNTMVYLTVPKVTASNAANGINVNWNSVDGAEKYIVYRKTYNDSTKVWGGWETLTSNCTATSYVDTKALLGVYYKYTAVAVAGDTQSSFVASSVLLRDVAPTVKVANATSGVTVTWNSVYGAQKYTVYRKTYNDTTKAWGSWEVLANNCTATTYNDAKALLGVKYMYTVRATRNGVSGSFVASGTLQRDVAPVVKVANATSGVTVTWNSVYGAQKYTVCRKTYNDTTKAWGSWEVLANNCTATTYTDTKAMIGVKYIYTVVAVRNGVSGSFVASGTLQRDVAPVVKVANATSGVTVTWNSVYGAQKYTVYRKTYNDTTKAWGSWEVLANNCTATTYNDAKALLGVKYIYTVVAVRNGVNSSFVATGELQRNVAPAVTIAKQSNGIKVNWSSVYGSQKYTVYRKTYNATTKTWGGWQAIKTGCTGTSYTDTTVKNGTYYRYTVCGVRNGFQGSFVQSSVLQYVK